MISRMSYLNWCTYCDRAINSTSDALYCSDKCQKLDASEQFPLLEHNSSELGYLFSKKESFSITLFNHVAIKKLQFCESDDHFSRSPMPMCGGSNYNKTIAASTNTENSMNLLSSQSNTNFRLTVYLTSL
ncbi:hypothetical protein EDC96DRAFT_520734 [Choanephora cucurbitarum]|nr:hypothetical protein EDC96DRAFT_520734 [Choanephora cucurbitarum]